MSSQTRTFDELQKLYNEEQARVIALDRKNTRLQADLDQAKTLQGQVKALQDTFDDLEGTSQVKDNTIKELRMALDKADRPRGSGNDKKAEELQARIKLLETRLSNTDSERTRLQEHNLALQRDFQSLRAEDARRAERLDEVLYSLNQNLVSLNQTRDSLNETKFRNAAPPMEAPAPSSASASASATEVLAKVGTQVYRPAPATAPSPKSSLSKSTAQVAALPPSAPSPAVQLMLDMALKKMQQAPVKSIIPDKTKMSGTVVGMVVETEKPKPKTKSNPQPLAHGTSGNITPVKIEGSQPSAKPSEPESPAEIEMLRLKDRQTRYRLPHS
ncbi:MAG: hypothetical protein Q9161_004336 [Pseudevernia consocians]